MKIGIDLDDVTVALMDGLLAYHNKKYKTNWSPMDHIEWDLHKFWQCTPQEAMKRVYDFYESDYMDNLLPMIGAVQGIKQLNKKHYIYFITSRPYFIEEKTKKWLNKYFPDTSIPLYLTNQYSPGREKSLKKSDICKNLNISHIIEDSPSNITDCTLNGIQVLLYNRPWNTAIENNDFITRVYGWNDVLDILK